MAKSCGQGHGINDLRLPSEPNPFLVPPAAAIRPLVHQEPERLGGLQTRTCAKLSLCVLPNYYLRVSAADRYSHAFFLLQHYNNKLSQRHHIPLCFSTVPYYLPILRRQINIQRRIIQIIFHVNASARFYAIVFVINNNASERKSL